MDDEITLDGITTELLRKAQTGLPVKTIFATALNDLFRAHSVPVID